MSRNNIDNRNSVFLLSESNENTLFATLCCLWSPREFELFNGRSFYTFILMMIRPLGSSSLHVNSPLDTELRYGKLIEPKTPWTPQTMPVYCFKESFSWTNWIKRKLKSMQSKELFACFSGLSTLQPGTHYSKKQNIHMPRIEKGLLILD